MFEPLPSFIEPLSNIKDSQCGAMNVMMKKVASRNLLFLI